MPKDTDGTPAAPVSAVLKDAGKILGRIGQEIEDSQVEDGDPPFAISGTSLGEIHKQIELLQKAKKQLTQGDDCGE